MSFRLLTLASLASLVAAQTTGPTGYGRYPCTNINGDGTFSTDQTICDAPLQPYGDGTTGDQGDGPVPVGSECYQPAPNTPAFCGIAGASCTDTTQCDNGYCDIPTGAASGTCQGGFGSQCNTDGTLPCTGFTYCEGPAGEPVATCGGLGAFCQDGFTGGTGSDAQDSAIFNQACASGYCNFNDGFCDTPTPLAGSCAGDGNQFSCVTGTVCTGGVCLPPPAPTARLGRRTLNLARRDICPASHTACAVSGSKAGFECIDTTSNLEQCGACASAGGVDCTALPGVEGVACVSGQCEIWSCAENFSWNSSSGACEASA